MRNVDIDFEWARDTKGYQVVAAVPAKPGAPPKPWDHPVFGRMPASSPGSLIGEGGMSARSARIVRRGGDLSVYRPLDKIDNLFSIFASMPGTADGVHSFISQHGPLTETGHTKAGESVSEVLEHVRLMKELLRRSAEAPKALAELLGAEGGRLTGLDVTLVGDTGTNKVRLKLSPRCLLDALWIQVGQKLSEGGVIRRCRKCGGWFEAGPGTGRRLDAKFCSDSHRVTFNSHQRSREGAPTAPKKAARKGSRK